MSIIREIIIIPLIQIPTKGWILINNDEQKPTKKKFPEKYFTNNSKNSEQLFNICFQNNLSNIIFSSSAAIYGNALYADLIPETAELKPLNPYGESKIKTEKFFKDLNIKNLSIYFDPELNLVKLLTLRGVPTTVILNKDRDEIARIIGILDFNDEKFISWINDILSSKKINH